MGVGSGDCQSELPPGHQSGVCPSVCGEANTLIARRAGDQPHRHNPGLYLIHSQTQGYLFGWIYRDTDRYPVVRRGGSEAQALAVRACMTKVDQQTEGLEGVPGHLLQAASLIASVSHFSISSPQMTASCSGLCMCHLHLSTQYMAQDWSGGTPTGPALPQKRA